MIKIFFRCTEMRSTLFFEETKKLKNRVDTYFTTNQYLVFKLLLFSYFYLLNSFLLNNTRKIFCNLDIEGKTE